MEPLGGETRTIQQPTVLTRDEPHQIALGSALDFLMTESTSREWTDEKHSLYLNSMEESFVNQLYEAKFCSQRNRPSGQFKMLQGGSWKKISFERPENLNKAGKCHVLAASPWIQRLRPGYKLDNLVSTSTQENAPSKSQEIISNEKMCRSASSSKHFDACNSHLCHHESSGNTEVSDQNFDDEGKGSTQSSGYSTKRKKRSK